ncbi:MAG: DUF4832 domain-containing protein [Pseudobutyrivibrio sp.]|nr:DUF4832 domain-containing protein [Pseudobutyrivibrio sp.]
MKKILIPALLLAVLVIGSIGVALTSSDSKEETEVQEKETIETAQIDEPDTPLAKDDTEKDMTEEEITEAEATVESNSGQVSANTSAKKTKQAKKRPVTSIASPDTPKAAAGAVAAKPSASHRRPGSGSHSGNNGSSNSGGSKPVNVNTDLVKHDLIKSDTVPEINPLKGLIPFSGQTSFPHSMEWFYIPVSDVEVAEGQYDWTALEDRLNAVSDRGHQAVLRFYYDYPGETAGVPSYLINDYGLEMKPYDEPDALGGSGRCPDYSNQKFRQSMQNFISAFGQEYDGDPRIGFITEGLLGFWGEWHNWPFDEDTSDGKPDWSIPTQVYKEVYEAYDDAFDVTQLVVREPKDGIDNVSYKTGYHDDSFCYSTLSEANGGQSWSFMQRLINHNVENNWKFGAIGGEIYPPLQGELFKDSPQEVAGSPLQDWDACVAESHASWLMCDRIKGYSGTTKTNALNASKQLGYNLFVSSATFANELKSGDSLSLSLDIVNDGVAPFYYDHNTWPVMVGIKEDDTLVKKYYTSWDLNSVEALGGSQTFETEIENPGLGEGDYTISIKVENPLKGGVLFSFANQTQGSDGWLTLGTIKVYGAQVDYEPVEDDMGPGEEEDPVFVPVEGVYEAEFATMEGTACLSDLAKASNGQMVGWIGTGNGESGSLTFTNVKAEEAGTYTISIDYVLGEAQRFCTLDINGGQDAGGTSTEITFKSTGGWSSLGTKRVVVDLAQGDNTLHFHNDTGYAPNIDFIKVDKGSNPDPIEDEDDTDPTEPETPDQPDQPDEDTPSGNHTYAGPGLAIDLDDDDDYIYVDIICDTTLYPNWDLELNTDGNNATGYQLPWIWAEGTTGADFVVENGTLRLHHTDTADWAQSTEIEEGIQDFESSANGISFKIKKAALTTSEKTLASSIGFGLELKDGDWSLVKASNNGDQTNSMSQYNLTH